MSSPYTNLDAIEAIYGRKNVHRWADLDNDGNEEVIIATITSAITRAEININGRLLDGPYKVPFEDPIPEAIGHLAALRAGIELYNGRQVIDVEDNNQVTRQLEEYETMIRQIHSRKFRLVGAVPVSTDPIKTYPRNGSTSNAKC